VIHGYKTIFPVPIGEASSWDPAAVQNDESVSASEATADGIKWTFNPMVDVSRNPRWGRVVEGAGEDPFLGSAIAAAKVRGYAGAATVTSAFNSLDGVPASANPYLLSTILRNEWNVGGTVVSDYQAIHELEAFGVAASGADAARLALTAGVDIEMGVQPVAVTAREARQQPASRAPGSRGRRKDLTHETRDTYAAGTGARWPAAPGDVLRPA